MADLKTGTELVPWARSEADAVIAAVDGEIDLHNSAQLRAAVLELLRTQNPKKLVLDLTLVPYMDSSAVAVLVEALQKLRKVGGKVVLIGLQPRVKGLLEIARLDSIFQIALDEAQALAK